MVLQYIIAILLGFLGVIVSVVFAISIGQLNDRFVLRYPSFANSPFPCLINIYASILVFCIVIRSLEFIVSKI